MKAWNELFCADCPAFAEGYLETEMIGDVMHKTEHDFCHFEPGLPKPTTKGNHCAPGRRMMAAGLTCDPSVLPFTDWADTQFEKWAVWDDAKRGEIQP